MLGRHEVSHLHLSLAKAAQRCEGFEVRGLHKAEVVGLDAIDVVHHYPFVLANALPYVGSLAARALCVYLLSVVVVEVINLVANHILDAARIFLRHIGHEIATVWHGTDICIKHLNGGIRIFEKQLGFGLQSSKSLVGIAVIEFGATACLLTDSEIDHRLSHLGVPDGLWCPGTSYLSK